MDAAAVPSYADAAVPLDAGGPAAPTPDAVDAAPPDSFGGDAGAASDTLSPRVVSTVPADGATGITRDTSLAIAFSEPMDRLSVEAAFSSENLPATSAEFHWDPAGTSLTVVLGELLSYAAGTEPSQVIARTYAYRIASGARDLAGNPLPEAHVSFSTLREIRVSRDADGDPTRTGNWRSDGIYGTDSCAEGGGNMCVGDSAFGPNASYRGLMTFELSGLWPASAEIVRAELVTQVASVIGNPFGGLGQIDLERVTFAAIGPDAFAAPGLGVSASIGSVPADGLLRADVLGSLAAALQDGTVSQFRWRFDSGSDGDGATDLLFLHRAGARLDVSYLVP